MASVNAVNSKIDTTVKIFNNFYGNNLSVPVDEYNVVEAFFRSVSTDNQVVENFSGLLFVIAKQTKKPVLTLLDEIKNQDALQVNLTMAYYLNRLRSATTLLGVQTAVLPNKYVARNILP